MSQTGPRNGLSVPSQTRPRNVLSVLGDGEGKEVVVYMNRHNYKTVYMDTYQMNTYIPQEKIQQELTKQQPQNSILKGYTFWLLSQTAAPKINGGRTRLSQGSAKVDAPSPERMCCLGLETSILNLRFK